MTRLEELRVKYPLKFDALLDPQPWFYGTDENRYNTVTAGDAGLCVFSPRPGYSSDRELYPNRGVGIVTLRSAIL